MPMRHPGLVVSPGRMPRHRAGGDRISSLNGSPMRPGSRTRPGVV